jgi:hypothetical protein
MIDDDDNEQSEAANQDSNTNTLLTADTTITPASTSHQRNTSNSTAIDKRNIESIFRSSFLRDVARLPLVAPLLTTNKIIKTPDEIIRELGIKQGHLMVGKGKLAIHDIQRSTGATKKEAALLAVKAYQANAELRRGEDKQPAVANNNKVCMKKCFS